jgi:2'-5' RNA ligase
LTEAAQALEARGLRARFELREKLHVTLAFLGSVDAERVAELAAALQTAASAHPSFNVRLDRIGAFPNERRARIVWAGSRDENAAFARLAEGIRDVSRRFAVIDDKPAVLHVTLARLREPARVPEVALKPQTFDVDAVTLFQSLQAERTTRYEVVERFTLQASSPARSK